MCCTKEEDEWMSEYMLKEEVKTIEVVKKAI